MRATYKIRSNLTASEYQQLSKLRDNFDIIFPYAAELSDITLNKQFINTTFTGLYESVVLYYDKARDLVTGLSTVIIDFRETVS